MKFDSQFSLWKAYQADGRPACGKQIVATLSRQLRKQIKASDRGDA
jgi:hypothetical protein